MDKENQDSSINYEFNRRMMLVSVIILFVVCFFIVLFHCYARCFRNRRRGHILHAVIGPKGLSVRVLNSLPTFSYNPTGREYPMECAVCLSEFEENEMGRVLPECKHCFHIDCIDMWLHSHRDCPLCRTEVKAHQAVKSPGKIIEKPHEIVISIPETMDSGASSGLNPTCESEKGRIACCSSSLSTMAEVPIVAQLTGPIGQDPNKSETIPDLNELGSDIESGPKPVISVRVFKRLFSM